jgi:hypothetical protein
MKQFIYIFHDDIRYECLVSPRLIHSIMRYVGASELLREGHFDTLPKEVQDAIISKMDEVFS